MKIGGSYGFPAPRPKVWAALLDPARLAAASGVAKMILDDFFSRMSEQVQGSP